MDRIVKVLVIEDNIVNAQLLKTYLSEAGFEVLHIEDGNQATETITTHRGISVILLDRMMPGIDGLQLLMILKRWPVSSRIPVIMLTSALSPAQIADAKLMGAYACLPKPYDKEKIIATIKAALNLR